jgi:hypothetical protein
MEIEIERRNSSKLVRRRPVLMPLTGDMGMNKRLSAIAEGIRLSLRKKSSVMYSNFDPSFKEEKSLDVRIYNHR